MSQRKKKREIPAIVYLRYVLPIIFCVLMIVVTFIPCLRYSTTGGVNERISSAELFENSWDQVRDYLFSGGEKKPAEERFSQVMLVLLILLAVLFAIGVLSTVIVAYFAFRHISYPDRKNDVERMWFITIVPNRIAVCILQGLTLPLLFLSRMIAPLYDVIMNVDVLVDVNFPEPWVWGLILIAVSVVLSVVSAGIEKEAGVDVFKKRERTIVKTIEYESDDDEKPHYKTDEERMYADMQRRSREEQAERIRKLLNKDADEE